MKSIDATPFLMYINFFSMAESNSLRWLQTKTESLRFASSHVRSTISNRRMPHRRYWNSTSTIAAWTPFAIYSFAEPNIVAQQFIKCARHQKNRTKTSRTECIDTINVSICKSEQVNERWMHVISIKWNALCAECQLITIHFFLHCDSEQRIGWHWMAMWRCVIGIFVNLWIACHSNGRIIICGGNCLANENQSSTTIRWSKRSFEEEIRLKNMPLTYYPYPFSN